MTPMISVIIPCHNVESYIDTCLNSIVNQTFSNIEIICIDDHSTDKTLEKLKEWQKRDNRILIYSLNILLGAANARNFGIKIAKGNFITFIDSDDFVVINFLEDFYKIAESTKIPIVSDIHCSIREKEYNNMDLFSNSKESGLLADFNQDPSNILKFSPHITGKLYKKEAITTKFLSHYIWEDLPFFVETSLQNKITYYVNAFSSNSYYFYRQNELGVTKSLSIPSAKNLDIIHVMQFLLNQIAPYYHQNETYQKAIDSFIANFLFQNLKIVYSSSNLTNSEQKSFTISLQSIYQYYFPDFIHQISIELIGKYQEFYEFLNLFSFIQVENIKEERNIFLEKTRKRKKEEEFLF